MRALWESTTTQRSVVSSWSSCVSCSGVMRAWLVPSRSTVSTRTARAFGPRSTVGGGLSSSSGVMKRRFGSAGVGTLSRSRPSTLLDGLARRGLVAGDAQQAAVEGLDEPVAGGDRVQLRRRRDLALDEHVVVADHGVERALEPFGLEGPLRLRERARVGGGVEVGAEVERVGLIGRLHAVVAGLAAVRGDVAALEGCGREVELVALRVVGDVAGDEHRLRLLRVERAHGGVERLRGERLLRAEGRRERRAEPIHERHPRG